jgi:hypothetical protein
MIASSLAWYLNSGQTASLYDQESWVDNSCLDSAESPKSLSEPAYSVLDVGFAEGRKLSRKEFELLRRVIQKVCIHPQGIEARKIFPENGQPPATAPSCIKPKRPF